MNNRISCILGAGLESRTLTEIAAMPNIPGPRITPIRHEIAVECVSNYVESCHGDKIIDLFHSVTENGARYHGLVEIGTIGARDFRWVVCITNAMDGSGAFTLHSGIVLPDVEMSLVFHASETVVRQQGFIDREELQSLVNEKMIRLRDYFNLCFLRMDHLKSCKLTNSAAAELIVSLIGTEVVAGRLAHEFILAWKKPVLEYLKPRNMWSLYCLCAWLLKRLRDSVLIDRTVNLNHFFDDMSKFDKKPTRWVQETFA